MKLKKTFIYTLLILLSSACVTRKELPNLIPPKNAITVTHHRNIIGGFERPVIVETWNDFNPKKKFIRETIDKYNRVTKLEFFREENVLGNHVLPASIINYEYERDKIIETLLDKFNQKTYADEHGCSYKTIYHLDENKFIIKVERFTDYESISPKWEDLADLGYKPPTIEELKEEIKYTDSINNRNTGRQIEFYKYSFAKMDGVYPVSKDFDIEKEIDLKAFIPTMEKGIHKGVEKLFKNLKE